MFDSILWWDFCAQLWNVNSDAKIKNPNISQTSSIVRMSRWRIKSGTIVIKSAVVCRKKGGRKEKCVEHRIAMGLMLSAISEMVKIIIEKMTRAKPLILNNNRSRAVLISLKESLSLSGLYFIFFFGGHRNSGNGNKNLAVNTRNTKIKSNWTWKPKFYLFI